MLSESISCQKIVKQLFLYFGRGCLSLLQENNKSLLQMKKFFLVLLWTLFIPLISPSGSLLLAQGGRYFDRPVGGNPPTTPTDVQPPIITNPGNPPAVITGLTDPLTGATLSASISVSTTDGGTIELSLYHSGRVYSAGLTNLSTGGSYWARYFTDSHVSFSLHGNGYYEICVRTDHGEYYGYVMISCLPGPQVPSYTIDEGLPGEWSLDPFGHFIH